MGCSWTTRYCKKYTFSARPPLRFTSNRLSVEASPNITANNSALNLPWRYRISIFVWEKNLKIMPTPWSYLFLERGLAVCHAARHGRGQLKPKRWMKEEWSKCQTTKVSIVWKEIWKIRTLNKRLCRTGFFLGWLTVYDGFKLPAGDRYE